MNSTRKKFMWGELEEEAIRALKESLTSPPILALSNFEMPLFVETDAFYTGVGAFLPEIKLDGKIHPVQFANKKMSPRREALFSL